MVKFGKQIKRLADANQLDHCVAYDVLKKAINLVVGADKEPEGQADLQAVKDIFGPSAGGAGRPPDSRFHSLLQHELAKVNTFASLEVRTLIDCMRDAHAIAAKPAPLPEETLLALERRLDSAAEKLISIEHFRRLNFTGFRKIVKKFDKQCAGSGVGSLASWFLPALLREPFVAEPLDALVLALAWGYAALRKHRSGDAAEHPQSLVSPGGGASVSFAASGDGMQTTKTFWLQPPARMRALCTLVKRFDLVVPPLTEEGRVTQTGSLEDYVEQTKRLLHNVSAEGLARAASRVKADNALTYYDDEDFSQYLARVRGEGPCGYRRRLTVADGQAAGEGPGAGLTELDGSPAALSADAFTTRSAPQPSWGRRPVVTVGSSRVLLRGDTPATAGVCIALDEDVQFTLVAEGGLREAKQKVREATDFPYCLLEVSCEQGDPSSGAWLEELWNCAALRTVQGFSVGAHAVASSYNDKVPVVPQWYQHLQTMKNAAPPEAWGLLLEWRAAVAEETQSGEPMQAEASPMLRDDSMRLVHAPAEEEQSEALPIEPKNLMASERTMLEWLHTVLALAFLGIGLWRYSLSLTAEAEPARLIAFGLLNAVLWSSLTLGVYSLFLIVIAVAFAWYTVFSHVRRLDALMADKITERIFNWRPGPLLFATVVGIALASHLFVQVLPSWWWMGTNDLGIMKQRAHSTVAAPAHVHT